MCSGTALLYKIPRIVIGENRTFQGPEDYIRSRGVKLEIVDDVSASSCHERVHRHATGTVERRHRRSLIGRARLPPSRGKRLSTSSPSRVTTGTAAHRAHAPVPCNAAAATDAQSPPARRNSRAVVWLVLCELPALGFSLAGLRTASYRESPQSAFLDHFGSRHTSHRTRRLPVVGRVIDRRLRTEPLLLAQRASHPRRRIHQQFRDQHLPGILLSSQLANDPQSAIASLQPHTVAKPQFAQLS